MQLMGPEALCFQVVHPSVHMYVLVVWECPTHPSPSSSSVDSWRRRSNLREVGTSATRMDWSRTWRPVEYHRPISTVPRLPDDLGDLVAMTPLTTLRPHVLAPSRQSDKLVRQTLSTGQWACGCCDHVCDSWIGLYTHRKSHRWGDMLSATAHSITCMLLCSSKDTPNRLAIDFQLFIIISVFLVCKCDLW